MKNADLYLSFQGADPLSVLRAAVAKHVLPSEQPELVAVENKQVSANCDIGELALSAGELTVSWEVDAGFKFSRRRDSVVLTRSPVELTPSHALGIVAECSFAACVTSPPKAGWWRSRRPMQGWGLFLKGNGHHLVSRRLLDRGPWRVVRDEACDVTLLQLCDLEVDEATASDQAAPGQDLLGSVWNGGHYASQKWAFESSVGDYKPSFYEPATKTSVLLVQDREVSAAEMGIASATRVHQIFEQPVEHVRFVYVDEAMARKQLPELWLRGLEVYAMTAEGERRIDTEYEPPPVEKPEWVKRLDEA